MRQSVARQRVAQAPASRSVPFPHLIEYRQCFFLKVQAILGDLQTTLQTTVLKLQLLDPPLLGSLSRYRSRRGAVFDSPATPAEANSCRHCRSWLL
jgi:hypothetical protein